MNYIQKLIEIRKKKNISQAKLAEILETTQQQISKYERGVQEIPFRHIIKLATLYNVSIDYIAGLKSENEEIEEKKNLENNKIVKIWNSLTENEKKKMKKEKK